MTKLLTALKKFFQRSSKGFTLIELLVVIGILGILAATLVATIDPFEQLKKANDTKIQNAAVEFQTANVRYYAGQTGFPWDATNANGTACKTETASTTGADNSQDVTTPALLSAVVDGCLKELIAAGELKAGFTTVTGVLDKIYFTEVNNTLIVCYLPTSKNGQKDKVANWIGSPAAPATPTSFAQDTGSVCTSNGGSTACYWCTQ